jgi:hypothetical protein
MYYRHHLATEETAIVPRAAELLTPDDWAAVADAVPHGRDPLFGNDVDAHYEVLSRRIEPRTRQP